MKLKDIETLQQKRDLPKYANFEDIPEIGKLALLLMLLAKSRRFSIEQVGTVVILSNLLDMSEDEWRTLFAVFLDEQLYNEVVSKDLHLFSSLNSFLGSVNIKDIEKISKEIDKAPPFDINILVDYLSHLTLITGDIPVKKRIPALIPLMIEDLDIAEKTALVSYIFTLANTDLDSYYKRAK